MTSDEQLLDGALEAAVHAETPCVDELRAALSRSDAIPVAVGSGTLNDLTKLAAHQLGRPYMVVATAASMDGYTAFGASITHHGSKQTFACPALRAAGCPTKPEQIGISRERLRLSYEQAWYIRRRYTILDFARRAGISI